MITPSKLKDTEKLKELFSDFGNEFHVDLPFIAQALDEVIIQFIFSFQERKTDMSDNQYDNICYLNQLRVYILNKLAQYADDKETTNKEGV